MIKAATLKLNHQNKAFDDLRNVQKGLLPVRGKTSETRMRPKKNVRKSIGQVSQPRAGCPDIDPEKQDALKQKYAGVLNEPVPERLKDLIDRIREIDES
ncbi:MAG: NepR family anti-sigma factor [Pseudomonadota bacterium]